MTLTMADVQDCPDVQDLLARAVADTGLDDFGPEERQQALEVLVSSIQDESWTRMTEHGRRHVIDHLIHLLRIRLKLIADRAAHSEIAAQEIKAPIIVVGPPRSGSTLLHTLISLDPNNMAVEHWVCLEPSPPPALGAPSQQRLDVAEKRMMALFENTPDIFVTHPYMIEEGAGALAECGSDIMNIVSTSQQLWCFYRGESYRRFLLDADHSAALRFHHDFLQHLQWGTSGKRWALKGSDYALWLGELAAQYPDAMLVWTHRDLAQQLGSLANIQAILCGVTGEPVEGAEREAVGRLAIEHQRASLEKAMKSRDAIGEDRFMDVSYHDVMADPEGSVRRIYERFGLTMSEEHAAAIQDWVARNPSTKHGVHRYSVEEFGLDGDAINDMFRPYVERFGFGYGIRPALKE